MGEFIGEHSIHKKKKKDPKSYLPRVITEKEEQKIMKAVGFIQEDPEEQPNKKIIIGDPNNLLTAGTTNANTARPKIKDILSDSGIT